MSYPQHDLPYDHAALNRADVSARYQAARGHQHQLTRRPTARRGITPTDKGGWRCAP